MLEKTLIQAGKTSVDRIAESLQKQHPDWSRSGCYSIALGEAEKESECHCAVCRTKKKLTLSEHSQQDQEALINQAGQKYGLDLKTLAGYEKAMSLAERDLLFERVK